MIIIIIGTVYYIIMSNVYIVYEVMLCFVQYNIRYKFNDFAAQYYDYYYLFYTIL